MQEKLLREATSQCVAALEVLRSVIPTSESRSLIRDVFAGFLLLRWADLQDAEQEAIAAFEDRTYQPLLPEPLQWRHWVRLDHPRPIADRLQELAQYVDGLRGDAAHPVAFYLHALAEPLRRVLKVNFVYLHDFIRWVADVPFETLSERRSLLEVFDQVIVETGDLYEGVGHYATPENVARLVAALANPQPGERVYDPCFGSGNLLVAAWQQAERSRHELLRPGALLEVAGIEIDASSFLVGLTRMLLEGIEAPLLELGNSLERESLSSPCRQGFDVVMANPPIGVRINRDHRLSRQFPIASNDSANLFVQHVLSQLKPQGRAVLAVPEGLLFRGGAERELRRNLLEQGVIEGVIKLPDGVLAPYTSVKVHLLLLRKQGGISRVRITDACGMFERVPGRKQPFISVGAIESVVRAFNRPQLLNPDGLPSDYDRYLAGAPWTATWELGIEELAAIDWDLSPRRREKGGLSELLADITGIHGIHGIHGKFAPIAALSEVAEVFSGRHIKSIDLINEIPAEEAVGYVCIKDLAQGRVGRVSSWLRSGLAHAEERWALLPGDVLVSKSGTIGKAAIVRNGAVGAIAANGLYVLRADQERLDAGFLLAYLASPACQNWLSAQSHGTVIQHLNRAVLDELPIPLPPLPLQARAAAQFRELGTDALAFLTQAIGSNESDRIDIWLADLEGKVPKFVSGMDDTPPLTRFEPVVELVRKARNWAANGQVRTSEALWLLPLHEALLPLSGVSQIPPGPGLLTVLKDAECGVRAAIEQTTGHLPVESQARAICDRLWEWLRATIADLISANGLQVRSSPASLVEGGFSEFSVELENPGAMPLRNVHVETKPDWGTAEIPYLAERGVFGVHLRGDVPKQGGDVSLRLLWRARALSGQPVKGEIELVIRVIAPESPAGASSAELGGSPYVIGSPLVPQHGISVFYGREELIGKISRQIETHGNVVLLEGNRRTGKTSILKHLEGSSAIPGWLAVYASLQGADGASHAVGVPTPEVFRSLALALAKGVATFGTVTPLPDGTDVNQTALCGENKGEKLKELRRLREACSSGISEGTAFADFRDYLEVLLSVAAIENLGIVLMLDEFDKLQEGIDNGVTSPQVPENIRFLIQTYPKFSAILTGSRRLKRLREEHWSALYGLGTSIPVTALDAESARKVVTEPVRDQLAFSQEAIERVIEVTARHPFLMQCLCNRVFDYAVQTKIRSITASVVNDAARSLVRDNEHFASLWDYAALGPAAGRQRRQLILFLCARSFKQGTHIGFGTLNEQLAQEGVDVEEDPLDADLSYLRELDLIEFTGEIGDGEYRLAIPLMADWIEQQQDAEVVASRARTEAEEENA